MPIGPQHDNTVMQSSITVLREQLKPQRYIELPCLSLIRDVISVFFQGEGEILTDFLRGGGG